MMQEIIKAVRRLADFLFLRQRREQESSPNLSAAQIDLQSRELG